MSEEQSAEREKIANALVALMPNRTGTIIVSKMDEYTLKALSSFADIVSVRDFFKEAFPFLDKEYRRKVIKEMSVFVATSEAVLSLAPGLA